METPCFMCGKNTKYQCIRCHVAVCTICAPETPQAEKEETYSPMRRVGICKNCGDSGKQSEAQNKDESPCASTSAEKSDGNSGSAAKRKQWTREQKLEFIDLYKKFDNKARAARDFKARYKVELKSST